MFYFIILHLLASILFYAPFVGDGVTAYTPLLSNYKPTHTIQVNRPVDYDVEVGAQKIIDAIATSSFESLDLTAFGKDTNQAIIAFPLVGVHVTVPAWSVESEIRALYASFDMSLVRGAGAKAYVRHVPAVNATATVDIAPVPAHLIHHSILSVGQAFGPVAAAAFKANATSVTVNVQSSLKKASAPIETVTGSIAHVGKPFVRTITSFLPVGQSFGPVSFTSFHANVSHYTVDTAPFQPILETPLKSRTIHQWAVCGTNINELEVCLVDPVSVRELSVIDDGASNTERVGYNVRWTVAFVIAFGVLVQVIDAVLFQHSLPLIATTSNCTTVVVYSVGPVELPESTYVPIQFVAEETIVEFTPSSPAVSTDATTSEATTEAETIIGSDVEANLRLAAETAEPSLPPPSTTSVAELSTVATTKRDPATACAPYVKSGQGLPKEAKETQQPSTVKQGASATRRARRVAQGSSDRRIFLIHATDSFDHPLITVVVPSAQWADRLTRLQQSHFVESAFQLLALADSTSAVIQPAADKEVVSGPAPSLPELSTDATISDHSLDAINEVSEVIISSDVEIDLPLVSETVADTEDVAPASAIHLPTLDDSSAPVPGTSDQSSDAVNKVPEATVSSDIEVDLPLVGETVSEPTSTEDTAPASAIHTSALDVSPAPVPSTSDQPSDAINEVPETIISEDVEIDLPLVTEIVAEPVSTEDVAPASAIEPLALDTSSAPVPSTSSTAPTGRTRPVIISGARNLLQRTVQAAQSSNNKQQTTGPRPRADLKIKGAAARLAAERATMAATAAAAAVADAIPSTTNVPATGNTVPVLQPRQPKAPRLPFHLTAIDAALEQDGLKRPSQRPRGRPSREPRGPPSRGPPSASA